MISSVSKTELPESLRWLFPDIDLEDLDVDRDGDQILLRVLERGRMQDVRWALSHYGEERIHRFFRESRSTELTARTIAFWRAYFNAENEKWQGPPAWRANNSVRWPS